MGYLELVEPRQRHVEGTVHCMGICAVILLQMTIRAICARLHSMKNPCRRPLVAACVTAACRSLPFESAPPTDLLVENGVPEIDALVELLL